MLIRLFRHLVVAFALLSLAGCGVFGQDETYPCPRVFILDEAGNLVRFKPGPGRDITDILFEARIANLTGSCSYEDGGFDIELVISIDVQRGPASRDRQIAFDYFVAVPAVRPDPRGKRILPVQGRFEGSLTRMVYQDEVEMFLPVENPAEGSSMEIVIGFQLSEEEIEFNRAMRRR